MRLFIFIVICSLKLSQVVRFCYASSLLLLCGAALCESWPRFAGGTCNAYNLLGYGLVHVLVPPSPLSVCFYNIFFCIEAALHQLPPPPELVKMFIYWQTSQLPMANVISAWCTGTTTHSNQYATHNTGTPLCTTTTLEAFVRCDQSCCMHFV